MTFCFFFFNNTATTEISTLSLHDALPISLCVVESRAAWYGHGADTCIGPPRDAGVVLTAVDAALRRDRKSTRLNSSHLVISYAVFCLKKTKLSSFEFAAVRTCSHRAIKWS